VHHSAGFFVVRECDELRMPESILGPPFQKLNRCDQVRLEPSAQLHVFRRRAVMVGRRDYSWPSTLVSIEVTLVPIFW
jgi:hypothetical protein